MFQAIVKLFVVTKIEALLLKFPFQVPISLSDEQEAFVLLLDSRDHVNPILCYGSRSSPAAPRALENRVCKKHGHVAADPIALLGDA